MLYIVPQGMCAVCTPLVGMLVLCFKGLPACTSCIMHAAYTLLRKLKVWILTVLRKYKINTVNYTYHQESIIKRTLDIMNIIKNQRNACL